LIRLNIRQKMQGANMLYMIVEHFKNDSAGKVYRRAQTKGRMLPAGLQYVNSWVATDFDRCFQLMARLIPESERNGIWTIHSSIFPENKASHRLLLKFGFREVGRRELIAQLDGLWRSTLILERRSKVVGCNGPAANVK
jgi:Domain of unknown function (DUF3303)